MLSCCSYSAKKNILWSNNSWQFNIWHFILKIFLKKLILPDPVSSQWNEFFLKTIWLKVPEIHFFTYFTTRHLYLSTRVLPYYIKLVQSKMRCSLQVCVFEVKFKLFLNFAPYDDFCHVLSQYNNYTKIINWLI